MRTFSTLGIVALGLLLFGCGTGGPDKGEESPLPVEGSTDSWRSPTEHGVILFGLPDSGELAEDALYHAWGFTLSGPAAVTLFTTPITANLDTVMYLYRRDPGSTYWGRYIKRNDDFEGNMWSRIDMDLDAGEYRIMVKGYKDSIRGQFRLQADCTGEGCGDLTGVCPAEIESTPASTDYGISCIDKVLTSHSVPTSSTNFMVCESDRCDMPEAVRMAWDYYHSYWAGLVGWEEFMEEPGEELCFDVDYVTFANGGSAVDVDYGWDEMAMSYLFDADKRVLAEFQHNQSPTLEVYCGEAGEPTFDWPGESCFYAFMQAYPTETADAEVTDQADLTDDVGDPALQFALTRYAEALGLADPIPAGTVATYRYVKWPTPMSQAVYQVFVQSQTGPEIEYLIQSDGRWDSYLFYARDGESTDFSCESIEL